jgi:site-specific recombinase XerC
MGELSWTNRGLDGNVLRKEQRAVLPPYATDLLNADADVTSIQKLLGHRWLETTQVYVLANDQQVCEDYYAACQKLESWRSPLRLFSTQGAVA